MARKKSLPLIEDFNSIPEEALVPEVEQPYLIPEHWKWVKLGAITVPMETRKPKGDSFKYIDIDSIDNSNQTVRAVKIIATHKAPSRASRAVHTGDTLFSLVRPYLRNIALISERDSHAIASTGFYVCTPIKHILIPTFLFEVLCSSSFVARITSKMRGDNSPSVKSSDMRSAAIPLPPLEEQESIVEKLTDRLEKIDAAIARLQTFLKGSESRTESVLEAAVHGRLTEDCRVNLAYRG